MARAASPFADPRHCPVEANSPKLGARGRGARSNDSGRFEVAQRTAFDDGWATAATESDGQSTLRPKLKTNVTVERPRTIINYVQSPFVDFDRSINPYRGCEHGCIYCFARPTHAYYGLSAGLDFEVELFAKPNAAELLARELRNPKYKLKPIAIGTNTDPYQPIERQRRIMRNILRVLADFGHPVSILTKSNLIERDIDILRELAGRNLVKAMLSITTLDPKLARAMEPRAATPKNRLAAVKKLADAGVPTGVMTAPLIPGLNDHEVERLLEASRNAGATFVGYTVLRLPLEVADLFQEWLEANFPNRAARVMRIIREMNGGKNYDPKWSRSRQPREAFTKLIDTRFRSACKRLSFLTETPALNLGSFRPPVEKGDQLGLFDESHREQ